MCQCHCSIHGAELILHQPKINYWAWLWMTIIQWMKPSLSLLQMMSSLLMMRLKKKKQKRKRQRISQTKDEFYAFYLKKKKRSLLHRLINKFWTRRKGPYLKERISDLIKWKHWLRTFLFFQSKTHHLITIRALPHNFSLINNRHVHLSMKTEI